MTKVPDFTPEKWDKWLKDKKYAEDRVEDLEDELDRALDGTRSGFFQLRLVFFGRSSCCCCCWGPSSCGVKVGRLASFFKITYEIDRAGVVSLPLPPFTHPVPPAKIKL